MKALLFTDGGSRGNPGPAGIGSILYDVDGKTLDVDARYEGEITNNQAEYKGLLLGLKLAKKHKITILNIYMDSELVVKQIKGEYKVKNIEMKGLKTEVDTALEYFTEYSIHHVKREKNKIADKLVNIILDSNA